LRPSEAGVVDRHGACADGGCAARYLAGGVGLGHDIGGAPHDAERPSIAGHESGGRRRRVEGAGPVAAGGFAQLPAQGCTVMVFTADAAGFAEMRVSCT